MASKKKIEKSIESYQKRIEEHLQKVKKYSGKNEFLIDYWNKEIKEFQRKKKEKKNKLNKP